MRETSRWAGPEDEVVRAAWARERRAVARRHHPDRGGDPEAMRAGLDAVDRRYRVLERAGGLVVASPPVGVRRRTVRAAWRRGSREVGRRARRLRTRVPRHWAGSRRYIEL